jgi:hypothetical protein
MYEHLTVKQMQQLLSEMSKQYFNAGDTLSTDMTTRYVKLIKEYTELVTGD